MPSVITHLLSQHSNANTILTLFITCILYIFSFVFSLNHLPTEADPGFLDRGSNLQRGFDLLILLDMLLIFPAFLKILYENEIIMSQKGFKRTPEPL